ncbi:hypothetical protein JCM8097_006561 [Rhodosporidiobolus ruineniae]
MSALPPLSLSPPSSSSFVPYATPSISPQSLPKRQPAMAVAAAPPPISLPTAPPSPPSPPLGGLSQLAVFAAEMFVWLWFAPPAGEGGAGGAGGRDRAQSAGVAKHQVKPTDRFLRFCDEVLKTTQVSHSVVLLALLFISRLKAKNPINGAPGSEYRLAVTGLMLANKVLDDNTYTAQTWSQVSSLELQPLVAGEAEFLRGLDWSLHITVSDYEAWLKLLDGHLRARNARLGKVGSPLAALFPSTRKFASNKRVQAATQSEQRTLFGLGIDGASSTLAGPKQEEEEDGSSGRRTRRRLDGLLSAATTPTSTFATFTLPAPATAPHPQQPRASAPLPDYGVPVSAVDPSFPPFDVSPTSVAYTARRNAAARAVSASTGSSGIKREADEAFAAPSTAAYALPPFYTLQQGASGAMARSFSAGPAAPYAPQSLRPPMPHALAPPPPPPHLSIHPAHQVPTFPLQLASSPLDSRPSSSSSTASAHFPFGCPHPLQPFPPQHLVDGASFNTLADAFSPRYDPDHHRRLKQGAVSLGYYSLAAGHGPGHLRQTLPAPPAIVPYAAAGGFAPQLPSGLSTVSTSPASEAYSHGFPGPAPQLHLPHHAPHPPHHLATAYPTPFLPPGAASAAFPQPTSRQHSPPRFSPTSSSGPTTAPASSLPSYLQKGRPVTAPHYQPHGYPASSHPYQQQHHHHHQHPTPPQTAQQQLSGPHPFWSAYSNAGVPGVYWHAAPPAASGSSSQQRYA